ncbi:HYC_CC_PP family protein [Winogradskyella sp. PE311]|uniref:HYC_CC_PP family protein n=1 Tax=Winogradskyella sp. PE311 TaxID=3366943 RepID=UPI00397E9667
MQYKLVHKLVGSILSFLVLFSTMSFTVEKHYCGENLVDTSLFSESKKCGGMDVSDSNYVKKPCCEDTVDIVKGQDELNTIEFLKINTSQELILLAYGLTYSCFFESLPKLIIPHKDYSPPNLIKDIQVLDETYLI